jgi:protein phosphatase
MVADGIAGAAAGEVASQITIDVIPGLLQEKLSALRSNAARERVEAAVRQAMQEVNDALVAAARKRPDVGAIGTTLVVALCWRDSMLISHLGDSRAYLHRGSALTPLTEDHALAAQLVRWGKLTARQAEENPGRSTLLRYLGAEGELQPDFRWIRPRPKDRLLLCTDGLTGMLEQEAIQVIMESYPGPAHCCDALISRANQAGGKDNITVVVVHFLYVEQQAAYGQPATRKRP